jgi:hypothetical protein
MKKFMIIMTMLLVVALSGKAQVKCVGINGSFAAMVKAYYACGMTAIKTVPHQYMMFTDGEEVRIILYSTKNGMIRRITERHMTLNAKEACEVSEELLAKLKGQGMKMRPIRIKDHDGNPQDLYKNKFRGGNYCDVALAYPVSCNPDDGFFENGRYGCYVDLCFYPTR